MTRTLTASIIAAKDLSAYAPVFVIVVSDGTNVLGRFATYAPTIANWDGTGVGATGSVAKISDIRHEIDWRGGLSHMSELTIELIDDGTLAAALAADHPYTVEVWVCLNDGLPTKAKSIMLYLGMLDSYEIAWGAVTLKTSDIRERRYPKAVLTKVGIDNESSLCGYGLERSSDTEWGVTIVFHEDWLPTNSKGELVPICFGQPRKARGLLVSRWPGADDLDDGAPDDGERYLRGPLFLFSDMRLKYGDDDGNMDGIQTLFHYDSSRKVYHPITDVADLNDARSNYADEYGDQLTAIIRPINSGDNALFNANSVNFTMRIKPSVCKPGTTTPINNPIVLRQNVDALYSGVGRSHSGSAADDEAFIYHRITDVPRAQSVRAAWFETRARIATGTFDSNTRLSIYLDRGVGWGGDENDLMDMNILLNSTVSLFNNRENSLDKNKVYADAPILLSGLNPFAYGYALGPRAIGEFIDKGITVYIRFGTSTCKFYYYGANVIVAADIEIEDVNLAADIDQSFDSYFAAGGPASITPSKSIYSTLCAMFGLTSGTDTVASSAWAPPSVAAVPYTDLHDADRLDFQLAEDISGKDLIDRMCRDASLWVVHDQLGKEAPKHFLRVDDVSDGPHVAKITQATVKNGSFGPIRQGSVDDLYNRFRVRYWKNPTTGNFDEDLWVDEAGGNVAATHLTLLNGWCADSQSDYGIKRELVIEAQFIQDADTALSLLICLAAKHVRRPRMFGLTTWLNALDIEACDIPCLDHPLWRTVAQKCGGTATTYRTPSTDRNLLSAGVDLSSYDIQRGDWCHITSAALVTAGLDGWYRVRHVDAADGYIYLFGATTVPVTYSYVTWYVMPAVMVTSANLKPVSAEIDLEFVEIPKAPESVGDAW
jgi:hypothetical protein